MPDHQGGLTGGSALHWAAQTDSLAVMSLLVRRAAKLDLLAALLYCSTHTVVYTGPGVSTAAGVRQVTRRIIIKSNNIIRPFLPPVCAGA